MTLVSFSKLLKQKGIKRSMGYSLIRKGLPYYQPGRNILVDPDEFELWFKKFRKQENSVEKQRDLNAIIRSALVEVGIG